VSRAVILMYHIIDAPRSAAEDKYCCTPKNFDRQMRHLRQAGYRLVALDTLLSVLDGERDLQDRIVAVTFDDGFACARHTALPILLRYGIPATIFVPSDRIGASNDWMRSHATAPRALLSVAQLRELDQAGVTIGSHTRTHPRLTEIETPHVAEEIRGSKVALEQMLGKRVDFFAYPFGLYNAAVRDEVERAGYRAACSTRPGFNRGNVDRFLLRRIEVYGSDSLFRFRRKLEFGANEVSALFPLRYYAGRLAARAGLTRRSRSDA
jgi:peptidoglycan/xylan/chitin deacetylase (PgdA/CDA1 family)